MGPTGLPHVGEVMVDALFIVNKRCIFVLVFRDEITYFGAKLEVL
jgi:hypothetical protein